MTPNEVRAWMGEMRDLALRAEPMTDSQRAERRQQIVREYARAEARRQAVAQLDLRAAA